MDYTFHAFPWSNLMYINREKCTFDIVSKPGYIITSLTEACFGQAQLLSTTPFDEEMNEQRYERDVEQFPFRNRAYQPPSDADIEHMTKQSKLPVWAWHYHYIQSKLNTPRVKYISTGKYMYRSQFQVPQEHWYNNIDMYPELDPELEGEVTCYTSCGLTLSVWDSQIYIVSKDDEQIHGVHIDRSYALQEGDNCTHVWLVDKTSFVVYNDGDVFSVVVIEKQGG